MGVRWWLHCREPPEHRRALGRIIANGRPFDDYFKPMMARRDVLAPFDVTSNLGKFDVKIVVHGGGFSGQAQVRSAPSRPQFRGSVTFLMQVVFARSKYILAVVELTSATCAMELLLIGCHKWRDSIAYNKHSQHAPHLLSCVLWRIYRRRTCC